MRYKTQDPYVDLLQRIMIVHPVFALILWMSLLQYAQNCGQYICSFCMTGYIFSPLHDSESVCRQVMT